MVHFVGAGSGAADLITLRGKALLEGADVVIYAGSLVNAELLQFCREGAEIYNSAEMNLDEVLEVIRRAEREGKTTVRLHTGDPCLYGAIGEQMDELDREGIAYDVCPGVSSFCGAAAALEAEYTPAEISQTVIITRIEGNTPVPEKEKLRALAEHNATMVLFLSAGRAGEVVRELLAGGYAEDTPVGVVYKATWPDEKVFRCTIGTLEQTMKENNINRFALITVGKFLDSVSTRSKLYDSTFTTGYRQAKK